DLAIGTPVAGRSHEDIEEAIGCFAATIVLRTDLSGEPTFRALVHRVKNVALAAYAHQDAPLELVIERLSRDETSPGAALFRVAFSLQNLERRPAHFAGLRCEELDAPLPACKIDLGFSLQPTTAGLRVQVEY